jgi:hypothetical protein
MTEQKRPLDYPRITVVQLEEKLLSGQLGGKMSEAAADVGAGLAVYQRSFHGSDDPKQPFALSIGRLTALFSQPRSSASFPYPRA